MEPVAIDRVQQMIDDEAAQRFPAGAVPPLLLLQYGDHPIVEPGELYLRVIFGQDLATPDAWMDEYGDRLEDFRAQRLPEVKGLVFTIDDTDTAARRPAGIIKMDDLSLLDREEDEIARGLTPVEPAFLGSMDLATLDALVIAGIAASRAQSVRWCLARPAARKLSVGSWPASANGRPMRSSASARENWTSSRPSSERHAKLYRRFDGEPSSWADILTLGTLPYGGGGPHAVSRQSGYVASITRRRADLARWLWDLSKTPLAGRLPFLAGMARVPFGACGPPAP